MEGYLRRKATYGLTNGMANARSKPRRTRLKNKAKDIPKYSTCKYAIVDDGGMWMIDSTYRATGVREGWLKLTGWRMINDTCIMLYKHI